MNDFSCSLTLLQEEVLFISLYVGTMAVLFKGDVLILHKFSVLLLSFQ